MQVPTVAVNGVPDRCPRGWRSSTCVSRSSGCTVRSRERTLDWEATGHLWSYEPTNMSAGAAVQDEP